MSRPPLGSIAFLNIPWYSLIVVSAFIVGAVVASREEKRIGLPPDTVIDFMLLAVPLAIIGARAYYVAFQWGMYRGNPLRIFNIREGGLAVYGGVIMGALAAWITARRKRISFPLLLDVLAPPLILGQAIGRWGNYANMEAYGLPILDARWQWFPIGVEIYEFGQWIWHQATFFYESLWCFIAFFILRGISRSPHRTGDIILWYAVLYGAERAIVEGMRLDSLTFAGGLRVSQLLSAVIAAAALLTLIIRRKGSHVRILQ